MRVILEVVLQINPSEEQLIYARAAYQPTPESPEPDEEWLCGEVALSLILSHIEAEQATIISSTD